MTQTQISRLIYRSAALLTCAVLMACADKTAPVAPVVTTDPIRAVLVNIVVEHPAVWNDSKFYTQVDKIRIAGDRESYQYLVSTSASKQTQIIGRTETGTIRTDYAKLVTPAFYVTDISAFATSSEDPVFLSVGGTDLQNSYTSRGDLDVPALPSGVTHTGVTLPETTAYFTSLDRASLLGEDVFTYDRNFYIAGNSLSGTTTVRPFLATMRTSWNAFDLTSSGELNTLTFFDDLVGIEFLQITYVQFQGLYILGYDAYTNEAVMFYYKDVDTNNNHYHDDGDTYQQVWLSRLKMIQVDKVLGNFQLLESKVYIAGTTATEKGDTAGKLFILDGATGATILDKSFDYSDADDGFVGVAVSGASVFAYGYSHQESTGDKITKSLGWAAQLLSTGEAIGNTVYEDDNAVIRFTSATGGYEQHSYDDYGFLAIGGSRKTATGCVAFAELVRHEYK